MEIIWRLIKKSASNQPLQMFTKAQVLPMREISIDSDFDVGEITSKINKLMSEWPIQLLDIIGPNWIVFGYDMKVKFVLIFDADFNDLETRIKLEDLRLNVINHIESLKGLHIGIT
ncbi:hypothetical protein [Methanobrevibacter gottschalkii]|uniref:hypothetical protein n=1 Tax=Methanobrevibacter gottschalkii TaxID=190974 RepID=UPI0038CF7B25